ncbi:hypothetical protein ACWGB8_13880 [Kitasatospora sp. NPDC054939]
MSTAVNGPVPNGRTGGGSGDGSPVDRGTAQRVRTRQAGAGRRRPGRERPNQPVNGPVVNGLIAIAGAALLGVAVGFWAEGDGGSVLLRRWLGDPVPLLLAALLLVVAAWLVGRRRTGGLLVCAVLAVPLVAVADRPQPVVVVEAVAPGHGDRRVLILERDGKEWERSVELRTGRGLTARHWSLDSRVTTTATGPHSAVGWNGPDQVRVTDAGGQEHTVDLDPATGAPLRG